jgi:hypothetical protein
MPELLKDYLVTISSIMLTVALGVVGAIFFNLSLSEEYIVITIGAMSSLIIFAMESKMPNAFKLLLGEKYKNSLIVSNCISC